LSRAPRPLRRLLSLATALAAAAVLASGCIFVDDDYPVEDPYIHVDYDPVTTTIDADMILSTELGYGAGLFVEYTQGGLWRLWTSCDTYASGYDCNWDIRVWADSAIGDIYLEDPEGYDDVALSGSNAFSFYAQTSFAYDAVEFELYPGDAIEVEAVLDGYLAPDYVYWWGRGFLHEGAPGSPITFVPDIP